MCTISAIRLAINVYYYLKQFMSFMVLIMGFALGTTSTFKEAYGNAFDGYGFLVIMLACFSVVAMIMQRWATRKHNRFLLLFAFVLDTICLGIPSSSLSIDISSSMLLFSCLDITRYPISGVHILTIRC